MTTAETEAESEIGHGSREKEIYTLKTGGLKTNQYGSFWQPSTGSK